MMSTMQDLSTSGFEILKNAIKASNSFPSGENFDYYSCFPSFNEARKGQIKKIMDLMQSIVSKAGISENMKKRHLEERFDLLIDANDFFLDRANLCMDEECGIKRNISPKLLVVSEVSNSSNINGSWNKNIRINTSLEKSSKNSQTVSLLAGKLIQRPQTCFKDKIDNSLKPWEPRIKYKHNLLKPLDIYLIETEDGIQIFNHPYEFELNKFQVPESQLQHQPPIKYKKLEDVPLIMIEKSEDIAILLNDLRIYDEIAVDLEHHSYRTFQGITCLMQISTRDTDYIIDTLTLRSELHELNEIFTNPKVLKVFHGGASDILWLQRDLSLYVVNMFDTYHASKQLGLQYLSLAHLLKKYCNIEPNKHFQLADWRIRPLPEELIKYAREDTHYLLYIKDMLRNELINAASGQTNILKSVYDLSTDVCLATYKKPFWSEDSYMDLYRKSQKLFNNRQLFALKELHRWRDQTAREEDDSTNYVLPNHMLLHIAEVLPKEMQGILALCNPIPPLVRSNLLAMHNIIRKAIQQPLVKPILAEEMRVRMPKTKEVGNTETWNETPHDFSQGLEARADLPCLLDKNNVMDIKVEKQKEIESEHFVTVFDKLPFFEGGYTSVIKTVFVSPYERYRRVIPMVAEYEAKEAEKKIKEEEERLRKLKEELLKNEQETIDSINRVHDHFVKVVSECSAESNISNHHIPNCKRKRTENENEDDDDNNLIDVSKNIKNSFKRKNKKICSNSINQNDDDIEIINNKEEKIGPIRTALKKDEKKQFKNEMRKKGLLPAKKFNYTNVDFSSFQGGSKNSTNQTMFQEQKMKDKINKNKKKRRKQKSLKI